MAPDLRLLGGLGRDGHLGLLGVVRTLSRLGISAGPLAVGGGISQAPSSAHLFGTDPLGRDVLSRVLSGSREILILAPLAMVIGVAGGTVLGLVAAYCGALVDDVIGRLTDALLALPAIVVSVVVLTSLGQSKWLVATVVGFAFVLRVSRTVRAAALVESSMDYVTAARLMREGGTRIMASEIMPNVQGTIAVEATARLGTAIFVISGLTFIGFGVQPPQPDWALDISSNYSLLAAGIWWPVVFPASCIALLVVSVSLIADGVRKVLDS